MRTSILAFVLTAVSLATEAKPVTEAFGINPWDELDKLERGNLDLLRQIKLRSGGDLKTFLLRNKITVVHKPSDVACSMRQINALGDGCTVSINVTNGRVRNVNQCSILLRWRRPLGQAQFIPESGWAHRLDADPADLVGALRDHEATCDRRSAH
jgi:hypothetical protein